MSTPTTATAILPPYHPHPHYSYSHHQSFAGGGASPYRSTTQILPASNRLPPAYNASFPAATASSINTVRQHQGQAGVAPSVAPSVAALSTAATSGSHESNYPAMAGPTAQPEAGGPAPKRRRRSREPDWKDFYRNGLPKEIIVIDDSPEPPATVNGRIPAALPRTTATNGAVNSAASTMTMTNESDASSRHAARKRKRDDEVAAVAPVPTHYDPVHHSRYNAGPGSYASQNEISYQQNGHITTHHSRTSGSTISTDRTTSQLHTTAATSLSSNSNQYDEPQPGQKRKRTTRQTAATAAKKREAEEMTDAFRSYQPPPNPPKKAGEVPVRKVHDNSYNPAVKCDDSDGHYIVVPETSLTERYGIIKLLGQGTFGKVVQAHDRRRNKLVAIKIIRSVQKYRDASKIELRVLQTLKANDEENRNRCIHLRDCFDFRNHICIVMDLLGQSVFDFLKSNGFVPFPNSQIQSFARQLFTSVAFLHDLNLIHTDLKPENILLCDSAYQTFTYGRKIPSSSQTVNRSSLQRRVLLDTEIRLIDFGSATFQDEYHSSVVSTRHYRAPEIILGLGWSFPCDIWSIGCILVEFFTGDALFQTHDNLEHLAMMEAVIDARIDTHLVQAVNKMASRNSGNQAAKYFKRLKLDYPTPETTKSSRRYVKAMKRLQDFIPSHTPFLANFLDLLKKIFVYDPAQRITAKQALQHPWFKTPASPDDGTEAAKIRLERMRAEQEMSSRSASSLSSAPMP